MRSRSSRARAFGLLAFAAALNLAAMRPARAMPREIIILRHGEKQNAFALCPVGLQRSIALASAYLGRGATPTVFSAGEAPAAFFAITLHALELIAPAAATWGLPVVTYSVVPQKGIEDADTDAQLDERTRQAANDVLTNPLYDGKIVVMAWEHKHIANAKIDRAALQPATLRALLHLDALGSAVPKTWSGTNYDYFWIVEYRHDSPTPVRFRTMKQVFAAPYSGLPQNDWDTPDGLGPQTRCE